MSSFSPPKRPRNTLYQLPNSHSNSHYNSHTQKNIFKSSINSRIPSKSNSSVSRHTLYSPTDKSPTDTSSTQNKTSYDVSTKFPSLNRKSYANTKNTSSLDFTKAVKTRMMPKQIVQQKPKSKTRFNTRIVDISGTQIYSIGSQHDIRYVDTEKQIREDIEREQDEIEDMQLHMNDYEYSEWLNELEEGKMSDEYDQGYDTDENSNSDY